MEIFFQAYLKKLLLAFFLTIFIILQIHTSVFAADSSFEIEFMAEAPEGLFNYMIYFTVPTDTDLDVDKLTTLWVGVDGFDVTGEYSVSSGAFPGTINIPIQLNEEKTGTVNFEVGWDRTWPLSNEILAANSINMDVLHATSELPDPEADPEADPDADPDAGGTATEFNPSYNDDCSVWDFSSSSLSCVVALGQNAQVFLIGLGVMVSFFMLPYIGILLASGNEQNIQKAKELATAWLGGIALLLLGGAVTSMIGNEVFNVQP